MVSKREAFSRFLRPLLPSRANKLWSSLRTAARALRGLRVSTKRERGRGKIVPFAELFL